jgi:hypothetical protein
LIVSARCAAGVTVFDGDVAGWQQSVLSYTTLDFVGLPANEILSTQYSTLGATFTGFGGWDVMGPFSLTSFPQDGYGFFGGQVSEIAFSEPQHAFAAHGPGFFRFQLFSGTQLFHETRLYGGAGPNQFAGITSTQGFDRIRLLEFPGDVVFFDNLYFADTIPTPAAGAILMSALGLYRRRRHR